jgi:hypothetical protein
LKIWVSHRRLSLSSQFPFFLFSFAPKKFEMIDRPVTELENHGNDGVSSTGTDMTRFPPFLFLCCLLVACQTAGQGLPGNRKTRRRKPLLDFGSSEKATKSATPGKLYMGENAENAAKAYKGQPIRIGSNVKKENAINIDKFKTVEELLRAYETSRAAERTVLLRKLFSLKGKASDGIRQRQSELLFLRDTYSELLSQLDETAQAPAPGQRPSERPEMETKQVETIYLNRKFRLAIDQYLNGDFLGARTLATALLIIAPSSPISSRIKRLRKYAREHLLRESVLHTELITSPIITSKKSLIIYLRLTNRTEDSLFLATPEDDDNPNLGALDISYEEQYAGGTRSRDQAVLPIVEKKALSLKPGQKIDIKILVPVMHRKKGKSILGVYGIEGHLRPFKLLRGGRELPYLIPIFGVRVHVVDQKDLALVRDPYGSLRDQLDALDNILKYDVAAKRKERFQPKRIPSLERLLRTTFLTAVLAGERSSSQEKTFDLIESQLKKAPPQICQVLCSALSSMTRDPFRYSKEEWLKWFGQKGQRAYLRPKEKALSWPSSDRRN